MDAGRAFVGSSAQITLDKITVSRASGLPGVGDQ